MSELIIKSPASPNTFKTQAPIFDDIKRMMDDPFFREGVFNKYFKNYSDLKTLIMFLKTYELINDSTNHQLSSDQIIELVKECIHNKEARKLMVASMDGFMKSETKEFNKVFQIVLDKTNKIENQQKEITNHK